MPSCLYRGDVGRQIGPVSREPFEPACEAGSFSQLWTARFVSTAKSGSSPTIDRIFSGRRWPLLKSQHDCRRKPVFFVPTLVVDPGGSWQGAPRHRVVM